MRLRLSLIGCWLITWLIWSADVSAQPVEVSLTEYDRLLRATYTAAQRGDLLEVRALADDLTTIRQVRMPDGQIAPVDQSWLAEMLAQPTPDLPLISARLGALIDALEPTGSAVAADALQHWEAVFNEPPFNRSQSESWLTRFLNWLFERLADLLPDLPDVPEAPVAGDSSPISGIIWVMLAVVALLFAGLLLFWVRGVRRVFQPVTTAASPTTDPVTFAAAQRLAEAARQAGDLRNAVRYLYLAVLLWLDDQKILPYQPSLTNREHLQRLQDWPALRDQLLPLMTTFEKTWYGLQAIDEATFAGYEQQATSLFKQVRSPNEAAS
ncbi:MAG TPA: DUF4129 domain-containing protein [Chloroflexus aurantiacus]|uniref:Protein-glutamine gamma-glutamyltransferase-like C-terminal domain-containing protein n=1 Tax=Chloroflexus aurantiacus (strain ATCC 29366 / DSM 635 / J-10-fl) TaxID=324602 RepID=A9WJX3_CHLAA|nr:MULTISPECIES: DUF4129 domain-containing protein [Chloroflexus]ABY36589.1 conserved hypothetical protein [Chloroflexus aurantiacus J-10-fl]RMG51119.1 MAG: DUF4129 domain-containing protein [Chloroflexota bacterium]GIV95179.1 MAG: hypothetical protein KatS3mg056_3888 [Chloroflexus sp.]HBW66888.1 DUF4129 domain-containing protein [Chloroflexus aurantiacus]